MSHTVRRMAVVLWMIALTWWCWWGAPLFLTGRSFDTPAGLVSPMLVPGFVIGVVAALGALRVPNRWSAAVLAAILMVQVALVMQKW